MSEKDRRSLADKGRDYGLRQQLGETGKSFASRIQDAKAGNSTADQFGRSVKQGEEPRSMRQEMQDRTNEFRAKMEALKKASPAWSQDGLGVRGATGTRKTIATLMRRESKLPTVSVLGQDGDDQMRPEDPPRRSDDGSAGTSSQYPWDIIAYPDPDSTSDNPPYKARVIPGLAGGILPSNYDEEFDVGTGLKYGVVKCQTNGERVTSATIEFTSSFPSAPTNTKNQGPSSIDVAFGMIEKNADEAPIVHNFFKGFIPINVHAVKLDTSGTDIQIDFNWRIG